VTGSAGLLATTGNGIKAWLDHLPGYLSLWPRLDTPQQWALATSVLVAAVVVGAGVRRARAIPWRGRYGEVLLTGLLLALVPGLLQAPIAALNARPLTAEFSAVEFAMQARLYYLSFAGIALVVSIFAAAAWPAFPSFEWRATLMFAIGSCAVILASVAWRTVDAYRARSVAIGQIAREAVAALNARELPAGDCNVYLLGIRPPPEWEIYVAMDSVVKALSPDLGKVAHCLVHTDYETFIYLLPAGESTRRGREPYATRNGPAGPLLPRRVGDLEMVYLESPTALAPRYARNALLLAYEGGRFVDVTEDVASGRRELRLRPVR
jgi:hypothetical protein